MQARHLIGWPVFGQLRIRYVQKEFDGSSVHAVMTGSGACGEFSYLQDGIPIRPWRFCNINNLFELNTEQAAATLKFGEGQPVRARW